MTGCNWVIDGRQELPAARDPATVRFVYVFEFSPVLAAQAAELIAVAVVEAQAQFTRIVLRCPNPLRQNF